MAMERKASDWPKEAATWKGSGVNFLGSKELSSDDAECRRVGVPSCKEKIISFLFSAWMYLRCWIFI